MTPQRIAFLLPHFRAGGAERVVLNYITALDRDRFTPHLFLTRVEGPFLDRLPPDVTPIALGAHRALHLPRHIAAAMAEHDIALAYSATNAMNLALLAAPGGRRTVRVVSEHTPPQHYLASAKLPWIRQRAMRWLYPRAAAIAVPTGRIATELAEVIGRPIRTEVLPNPVVASVASPLSARGPASPPRIVSVGRLVAAKGFDTLIDACVLLRAAGTEFRLDIFGEGPLRDELQARIDDDYLGDMVTLKGHADNVIAAISDADLFVLASRREGFGNVLIEAMAAGVPVLAAAAGGPQTFIRDGRNGFLVEPDNPLGLAADITRLLSDRPLLDAARASALETARGFAIDDATRHFEALASKLIAARSTTG
ncbi:glycosyltransferase [Sphingomonas alpina]|uniref:Glycosyltransferase n=1 Tax=Sphingomonas alpina TaxID=653931 RepID=A0A7H0LFX6_9SPHN|nr:glycosyltransferase [Sphingomonas alpina]QNQ08579.1 glycosyltransferase [Sphingomonas alpina]